LLDHKLMELAARIPSRLKLHNGSGKYIFKKTLEDLLPQSILHRGKQGFGVPVAEWFRNELREWARATIFDAGDGMLNRTHLERIWQQHQAGTRDYSALLWEVFMFRQWQKLFQCEGPSRPESQALPVRAAVPAGQAGIRA